MKLAFAAALLVGSTAATISPDGGPTDQGIHSVGVYCKGLELEALSAKALSYTAKALEETFNSVHTAKDGATAHVVANGPMGAVAATNSLRGGVTSKGLGFTMVGGWHCRLCRSDDAALNMIRQAEWETEFAAVLAKAPYEALSNVQVCTIEYDDEDQSSKAVFRSNFDLEKDASVVIGVNCEGADLAELSVPELSAVSKKLKDSYNAIHRAIDGDEISLESLQVEGNRVFSGLDSTVEGWHCRLCRSDDDMEAHNVVFTAVNVGGWHCRLCRSDDATTLAEDDERTLVAWQELFVTSLHSDPAFKKVGECKIHMSYATQAS